MLTGAKMGDFIGFSMPDGAWMPPELVMILPELDGNQLKVLVVTLYNAMQAGGGEGSTIYDICNMTGLSRPTAIRCAHALVERGMLESAPVGKTKVYRPSVKVFDRSVKSFDTKLIKLRESDSIVNDLTVSSDSLNLNADDVSKKMRMLSKLRSNGVFLKTAQAILNSHDEEYIDKHLDFYRYALTKGLATGPGWLVLSIREGWPEPVGYEVGGEDTWRRYVCGEYAEFVER